MKCSNGNAVILDGTSILSTTRYTIHANISLTTLRGSEPNDISEDHVYDNLPMISETLG